jgi:hypothetical protein
MCSERDLFAHFIQRCCIFCKNFKFHENLAKFENSLKEKIFNKVERFGENEKNVQYLRPNLA